MTRQLFPIAMTFLLVMSGAQIIAPENTVEFQVPTILDDDAYQLWNECKKIRPMTYISTSLSEKGLETARVATLFESRLRAARIFAAVKKMDSLEDLKNLVNTDHLNVIVESVIFDDTKFLAGATIYTISLEYVRIIDDLGFGQGGSVVLWDLDEFGFGGTPEVAKSSIMETLSEFADKFVSEYLRVNEQACE